MLNFYLLRSCQGTPRGSLTVLAVRRRPFPEGEIRAEQWSGDLRVVVPPGPIPNPEVKRDIADGSVSKGRARVGRCQSLTAPWRYSSRGGFLCANKIHKMFLFRKICLILTFRESKYIRVYECRQVNCDFSFAFHLALDAKKPSGQSLLSKYRWSLAERVG